MNKPRQDILRELPAYSTSLSQIHTEIKQNEHQAMKKYLNQVIEVTGSLQVIKAKSPTNFIIIVESDGFLANGEMIATDSSVVNYRNQKVRLKGLFIGYDDLLKEIKLRECSILPITKEI